MKNTDWKTKVVLMKIEGCPNMFYLRGSAIEINDDDNSVLFKYKIKLSNNSFVKGVLTTSQSSLMDVDDINNTPLKPMDDISFVTPDQATKIAASKYTILTSKNIKAMYDHFKETYGDDFLTRINSVMNMIENDQFDILLYEDQIIGYTVLENYFKNLSRESIKACNRKIITISGSMRFYSTMIKLRNHLIVNGNIVFIPEDIGFNVNKSIIGNINEFEDGLKTIHHSKIDISDTVIIIDKDDDKGSYHIGKSTLEELNYAASEGKEIIFYSDLVPYHLSQEVLALRKNAISTHSKKIIKDDNFIDINKLSKLDNLIINTAYELADEQLKNNESND